MSPPAPIDPCTLPWIRIQTLTAARKLAEAASGIADATHRPLVLVTPPGATAWLGPGWMPALAARLPPGAPVLTLADCGALAGHAAAVLAAGVGVVVPEVPAAGRMRLRALAASRGLLVLDRRREAPVLKTPDGAEALVAALYGRTPASDGQVLPADAG